MNAAQKRLHHAALRVFAEKGSADVSVSELAQAAGVARGTIYNNLESTDHLFEQVASQLAEEMNERVIATYPEDTDAVLRLSGGIRLYVRRAHEEPHWGRFVVRFALTDESLRRLWASGAPTRDLMKGLEAGRYTFGPEQAPAALGLMVGTTVSAILLVLDGLRTWRDAGSDAAELVLRSFGVRAREARSLATRELPALAAID